MGITEAVNHAYRRKAVAERRYGTSQGLPFITQALVGINEIATHTFLPHVTPNKVRIRGTRLTTEAQHARVKSTPDSPLPILESTSGYELDPSEHEGRAIRCAVEPNEEYVFYTGARKPFKLVLHPTYQETELKLSSTGRKPIVVEKKKTKIRMDKPGKLGKTELVYYSRLASPHLRVTEKVVIDTHAARGKKVVVEVPRSFYINGVGQTDIGFPIELAGDEPVEILVRPYNFNKVRVSITYDLYGPAWPM